MIYLSRDYKMAGVISMNEFHKSDIKIEDKIDIKVIIKLFNDYKVLVIKFKDDSIKTLKLKETIINIYKHRE